MRCLGTTKKLRRCENTNVHLYCRHHRWQLLSFLLAAIAAIEMYSGLYQDCINPLLKARKRSPPNLQFGLCKDPFSKSNTHYFQLIHTNASYMIRNLRMDFMFPGGIADYKIRSQAGVSHVALSQFCPDTNTIRNNIDVSIESLTPFAQLTMTLDIVIVDDDFDGNVSLSFDYSYRDGKWFRFANAYPMAVDRKTLAISLDCTTPYTNSAYEGCLKIIPKVGSGSRISPRL
jgi:hypothetical protein